MLRIQRLPASETTTEKQEQVVEKRPLLIVDDEESLTLLLGKIFQPYYLVKTANSGNAALELIKQGFEPHVIICDQRMPGMSGAEVLQQSAVLVPKAVRVILTGYTDVNDVIQSINKGNVYKFITKPWKNEELIQEIRLCFDHYELTTRNEKLLYVVKQQFAALEKAKHDIERRNSELELLNKQLKSNSLKTVRALAGILSSAQRNYYSNHSQTVAIIARAVAEHMKLSEDSIRNITTAALLHDVGKASLPERVIIQTPEKLKGEERRIYESHVKIGVDIVSSLGGLEQAVPIIQQHHERYDGMGFPQGLNGPQIMMEAQILSVADMYHNLVYKMPVDIYLGTDHPEQLVLRRDELERAQAVGIRTIFRRAAQFHPDVLKALYQVARLGNCPPLQLGSDIPEEELELLKLRSEEKQQQQEKEKGPRPKTVSIADIELGMMLHEGIYSRNVMLMPQGKIIDLDAFNKLKNLYDLGKVTSISILAPFEEDNDDDM